MKRTAAIMVMLAAGLTVAQAQGQGGRGEEEPSAQCKNREAPPALQDDKDIAPAVQHKYAVTALSVNYLREAPDFTAELGNQALMGTPVEILEKEGYWRKVRTPDPYTAWCVDLGLVEMTEEEMKEYLAAEKIICTADYSIVTEKPGKAEYADDTGGRHDKNINRHNGKRNTDGRARAGNPKICDIVVGDILRDGGKSIRGYRKVILPSGETGYVRKKDLEQFGKWKAECDPAPDNIIRTAMRFLGVPYFWGGTSIKGVDCSGLTKMVWYLNGVDLPRNASQQAKAGTPVNMTSDFWKFSDMGNQMNGGQDMETAESFRQEMLRRTENLKKGDLIFFGMPASDGQCGQIGRCQPDRPEKEKITHVGIYIGEGRFIHASKYVRINSLIPGEKDFYENSAKLIKARRIAEKY